MIESQSLTKQLGGRTVVSDVSFRCEPGTVVLVGVALTHAPATGIAIYGVCLLALGIALNRPPTVATATTGRTHALTVAHTQPRGSS